MCCCCFSGMNFHSLWGLLECPGQQQSLGQGLLPELALSAVLFPAAVPLWVDIGVGDIAE